VQIDSFAKINLFLEVTGRFCNGYHGINTVFCSVSLCDRMRFALTKKGSLKLSSNIPDLNTQENLVYRIARYLVDRFDPSYGVSIDLIKRIPVTAGLGGGSSNAAVTLKVMNTLMKLAIEDDELHEIGACFGSDVPFFLTGGIAQGHGRGDQIVRLPDLSIGNILLVNPGFEIPSREAYNLVKIPKTPMHWDVVYSVDNVFNRLQDAVQTMYPAVASIIDEMKQNGAQNAIMSGSGPTCIGLFNDSEKLLRCKEMFSALGYWTYKVRTIGHDEYQQCFQNSS